MENKRWKQDEFIISTFQSGGDYERLKMCKEANFTMTEFTFMEREVVTKALEYCEELEFPSLVQDYSFCGIGNRFIHATDEMVKEAVDYYSKYKQVVGFYVWDEPFAENFKDCRHTTDLFKKHAPDKLAFSVIFPSYGVYNWNDGDHNWDKNDYTDYVDGFLEIVDPDVFSMDYYVFQINKGIKEVRKYDLWKDLGYCRKRALETNKPFWFYYQGQGNFAPEDGKDFLADMTVEKVRIQMMAALAYGVKQLSCFTANHMIYTANGVKTHLFEPVKELNAQVLKIGNFLLDKTSHKLYHTGLEEDYVKQYFLDTLSDDDLIETAQDGLIIGRLKDESGVDYLVVVNQEFKSKAKGSLQLKDSFDIDVFDENTGQITSLGQNNKIDYDLDKASCAVYVLNKRR